VAPPTARPTSSHTALLLTPPPPHPPQEHSRRLLEEQNREYEEALAADREKAKQRQAEKERTEAEAREREAREATERCAGRGCGRTATCWLWIVLPPCLCPPPTHLIPPFPRHRPRAEQEAAERRRAEAAAALERRRAAAAASLPPEPAPGAAAAVVRVRLPDGSNHQRRFDAAGPVAGVYGWVNSLEGVTFWKYSLVCNFPRRVYGADTHALSLQDAGLAPQGVLFVQVEDDDDGGGAASGSAA
jgi:FAS-associated factor 2